MTLQRSPRPLTFKIVAPSTGSDHALRTNQSPPDSAAPSSSAWRSAGRGLGPLMPSSPPATTAIPARPWQATGSGIHVRLHGVDAPELDQPFGTQSRALVTQLVVGRHVDVPAGRSHDRLVADLRLRDGRDVGGLLVAAGAAWVEPGYSPNPEVPDRQAAAQRLRLGLWRNASAARPWEWRHTHGQAFSQEPPARRSWWSGLWSWR